MRVICKLFLLAYLHTDTHTHARTHTHTPGRYSQGPGSWLCGPSPAAHRPVPASPHADGSSLPAHLAGEYSPGRTLRAPGVRREEKGREGK